MRFAFIVSFLALTSWQLLSKGSPSRPALPPPPQAAGYKLVFADDFDSLDLSPNGSGIHTWYQSIWWDKHIPNRSLIAVSNSVLTLKWRQGQGSFDTTITTFAHDRTQGKT